MTSVADRLRRAEELVQEGEMESAASELRSALREEPENMEALVQLSKILLLGEETGEAEHWINKALKVDSEHPEASTIMGILRLAHEDYNQAIVWFEKALAQKPELTYARMNLGKAYKELERWQEAERELREVHRQAKERALAKARERAKPGEEVDEDVGHYQALFELAEVLANTGRVEESIHTLLECLQVNPLYVPGYIALGEMYKMAEEYELAIEIYEEGLNHNPFVLEFRQELVELYQLTGNLTAAKHHQMEMTQDRQDYGDYLDLGLLATVDGHPEQAEAAFLGAAEKYPELWQADYNLAEIYKNSPELHSKAEHHYREAIKKGGDYACYNGLGLLLLGLDREGDLQEALKVLEKAREMAPMALEPPYNLAMAYAKAGRHDEALASIDWVISHAPDNHHLKQDALDLKEKGVLSA